MGNKFAVLSDAYGNWEATERVLGFLAENGFQEIIFLGDAIGYGPDPVACGEAFQKRAAIWTLGRIERLVLNGHFNDANSRFQNVLQWNTEMIKDKRGVIKILAKPFPKIFQPKATPSLWDWLSSRSLNARLGQMVFFHGPDTWDDEVLIHENVDLDKLSKIQRQFAGGRVFFLNGNHVPWFFSPSYVSIKPQSGDSIRIPETEPCIISIGSVGCPKHDDPRASFVCVEGGHVTWHRLSYDMKPMVEKLRSIPRIDWRIPAEILQGM